MNFCPKAHTCSLDLGYPSSTHPYEQKELRRQSTNHYSPHKRGDQTYLLDAVLLLETGMEELRPQRRGDLLRVIWYENITGKKSITPLWGRRQPNAYIKYSPVGRETRDSGKNLPGKQLLGFEPTTSHTVVEGFNR